MKNKLRIIIFLGFIFTIIIYIYQFNSWYSVYGKYDSPKKEDMELIISSKRKEFINNNLLFNSDEYSLEKLYNTLSSNSKMNYKNVNEFSDHINQSIISKIDPGEDMLEFEYISEEKEDTYTRVKYKVYVMNISYYREAQFKYFGNAKFSYDVDILEYSPLKYEIEI
ncbi:MAG: hypothetical protein Q4D02_03315 [Clostridia bacterium]|nr:hypothetical protein [Clostridia bacterium]